MKNKIITITIIAFIIRLILLIIDQFWFNLPQSGLDTVRFERQAYEMTVYGDWSFKDMIFSGADFHILTSGYLIYSVFGRIPFLWGLLMVLMGTATVYNIHRGCYLITNNYKTANKSAWIAAFFPNFAVLSATLLREVPIHFFLSLSLVYLISYIKYKKIVSIIMFIIFGIIASIYHSGVFAIFLGFLFYAVVLNRNAKPIIKLFTVLISVLALYYINVTGIGLNKFGGSFEGALEGALEGGGGIYEDARTNYPSWLRLSGGITDIFLIPIRVISFLFTPFIPFLAKSGSHLIGVFDGILYFWLVRNIYINRKYFFKIETTKAIITIFLFFSLAFSFGASNFGTNIRHRAKVLPALLILPIITSKQRKKNKQMYYLKKNERKTL